MTDLSGVPFVPKNPTGVSYKQGTLASIGYYLNKPWEWLSRGAGKLVGVDLPDSHTFWDQPTLADVIRKTSGAKASDVASNVAAATADIGLSILLDPINAFKVAGLTKLGKAAKASKLVEATKGLSRAEFIAKVANSGIEAGVTDGKKLAKIINKATKAFDRSKVLLDEVGDSGQLLGKTLAEQVKLGQRVVFGLDLADHPAARAILNKLPFNTGKITTRGVNIPGLSVAAAGLLDRLGELGQSTLFGAAKVINAVGGKAVNLPTSKALVKVQGLLNDFAEATAVGKHRSTAELADRASRFSGSAEKAEALVSVLEKSATDPARVELIQNFKRYLRDNSLSINKRVFGNEAGRTVADGIEGVVDRKELAKIPQPFSGVTSNTKKEFLDSVFSEFSKEGTALDTSVPSLPGSPRIHLDTSSRLMALDATEMLPESIQSLTQESRLPGITRFDLYQRDGKKALIGRMLTSAQVTKPTQAHIENLDALAALWAKKGYALQDAAAGDFLFGAGGSVQVIAPTVVAKVKGKGVSRLGKAASQSRRAIARLSEAAVGGLYVPKRLASTDLIRTTSLSDYIVRDAANAAESLKRPSGVTSLRTEDVITSLGNNALDHPEVERAASEYLSVVQEQSTFHPIKVSIDTRGRLIVTEGMERLKAAQLLGMDEVPVVIDNLLSTNSKATAEKFSSLTSKIEEHVPFSEALGNKLGKPASFAAERVGYETNGLSYVLDDRFKPLTANQAVRNYASTGADLLKENLTQLTDFLESPVIRLQHEQALQTLERRLGTGGEFVVGKRGQPIWKASSSYTPHKAALAFLTIVQNSETPEEILQGFSKYIRSPFLNAEWARAQFDNFKQVAVELEDALSKAGFLGVSKDPVTGIKAFLSTNPEKTVLNVGKDGKLIFASGSKTAEDLRIELARMAKKLGRPSGGSEKVLLIGTDQEKLVNLSEFTLPQNIIEPKPDGVSTLLGKETRGSLKAEGIYVDTPLKREPGEPRPTRGDLTVARATSKETRHWNPGFKSGFFDPTGTLVASTDLTKPADVIDKVYGQGPMLVREIFFVHPKAGIILSNVLGLDGSFTKLDREAADFIGNRLKQLSKKFTKMGFDSRTPIKIVSDLPEAVQKELIPYSTLGDLQKADFKLPLPDSIKGYDMRSVVAVGATDVLKATTGFPDMDKLAEELAQVFDEQIAKETLAGIPTRYVEGYFPRVLGPAGEEALLALDNLFESWRRSNRDSAIGFSNFWDHSPFKGRKYSTLTLSEINQVWKEAKQSPEDLISYAKREKHPFLTMLASADIANGDTGLMEFFIGDPLLATKVRTDVHITALAQKELYDKLVANFAIASGTPEEVFQQLRPQQAILQKQREMEQIQQELGKVKQAIEKTPKNLIAAESDTYVKELEAKANALSAEIADLVSTKLGKSGIPGSDLDAADGIFMSKVDAQALIQNPELSHITAESFLQSTGPYVRLNLSTVKTLEGTGTKVAVFPREIIGYLQRHFDIMNNTGGVADRFLERFYDPVQRAFKKLALFSAPRALKFVTRNIFSDTYRMWVAGIRPESVLESWSTVGKLIPDFLRGRDPAIFKAALDKVFVGDFGQTISFKELWSSFIENGGITTGLNRGVDRIFNEAKIPSEVWSFLRERGWAGAMDSVLPLAVKNKAANLGEHLLFKTGQRLATASETVGRFGVFLDTWKKTGDFKQAIQMVQQIMFDYDQLLAFERKALQRVFPFWAWLRNSIPFSIKYAATEPIKAMQTARAFGDLARGAGGWPSENDIPQHLQSLLLLPIFRKDGVLYASVQDNFLPVADLARIFGSKAGLFEALTDTVTGSLSPIIQTPVELLTGTSLFTGQKLELAPGQPARSGTLSSLGFTQAPHASGPLGAANLIFNQFALGKIPAANQLLKFIDTITDQRNYRGETDTPFMAFLIDSTLSSLLRLDPVRARALNQVKDNRLRSSFRAIETYGRKSGRQDLVDFARKRLLLLELEKTR